MSSNARLGRSKTLGSQMPHAEEESLESSELDLENLLFQPLFRVQGPVVVEKGNFGFPVYKH